MNQRTSGVFPTRTAVSFGPFVLDITLRELCRRGVALRLEPKMFDVLVTLITERNRVVSREELLQRHWPNQSVCYGAVAQCIWCLRKALDDKADSPRFIKTVSRRGYRFVGPITVDASPSTSSVSPQWEQEGTASK